MHFDIYSTLQCNLRCSYCYHGAHGQKVDENGVVQKPPILGWSKPLDPAVLGPFLVKWCDQNSIVNFMGGEPLLNPEWMKEMMGWLDMIEGTVCVTTNGTLFNTVDPAFMRRIDLIQLSIDGPEHIHDKCRGMGTFKRIMKGTEYLHKNNWNGEILARMTIPPDVNMYEAVNGLTPFFDNFCVQWQNGCDLSNFNEIDRYEQVLQLWDLWKKDPSRYNIIPLTNLYHTWMGNRKHPNPRFSGCQAGWCYFQIFNDGNIYSCAERLLDESQILGRIDNPGMWETRLIGDDENTKKCLDCPALKYCGCRCLNFNPESYCRIIRKMVEMVPVWMSEVENLKQYQNFLTSRSIEWQIPTWQHWAYAENMF